MKFGKLILLAGAICFIGAVAAPFTPLNIENLPRGGDRIVYQHIEKIFSRLADDSFASIVIIKDGRAYLITDGYDDTLEAKKRLEEERQNRAEPTDLWPNKIDGAPDFICITSENGDVLRNTSKDFTDANYGTLFKETRNAFIKRHVAAFKALLFNKRDNSVIINNTPIPQKINDTAPTKYKSFVKAKAIDGTIYFAQDEDGDGVTETFTANLSDGFSWGYNCGPNIINIVGNSQDDIKALIGTIVADAQSGSEAEQKLIKERVPTDKLKSVVDDVYRISPEAQKIEAEMK